MNIVCHKKINPQPLRTIKVFLCGPKRGLRNEKIYLCFLSCIEQNSSAGFLICYFLSPELHEPSLAQSIQPSFRIRQL